jgi:ABC-2 type transport system permease protein
LSGAAVDQGAASGPPPGFGSAVIGGRSGFDPGRAEGGGPAAAWRSFTTSVRLGWAMEANWTDPVLFFIYSVAKPVSAALILVVMLEVIGGASTRQYRGFVVVGSALWAVVVAGIAGLAWSILEDRERYRMIKYVVVTPPSLFPFLLGRSAARVLISFVAVALTLAIGVLFLGVDLQVSWLYLVAATLIGVLAVVGLGIFMAGWCLQLRQEAWSYPEAIAGALYLASGAIFPVDILPAPLHPVAYAMPTTWWLEASRRGLLGHGSPGAIGELPDALVMLFLLVSTAVAVPLALAAFAWFMRRARQAGLLDMVTGS